MVRLNYVTDIKQNWESIYDLVFKTHGYTIKQALFELFRRWR